MTVTAYIGLGSNLGEKRKNLLRAIQLLNQISGIKVTKKSSFYLTTPVGYIAQPDFLNAVVEIETNLTPNQLLTQLLQLEKILGRIRQKKWGPRIIDLDILLYNDKVIRQKHLIIPHPQMHRRLFVLEPLVEIAPQLRHPVLHHTMTELLQQCK